MAANREIFEELYWGEILTLKIAFEVLTPNEQLEINKYIPDMIEHLINKNIIAKKNSKKDIAKERMFK